MPTLKHLLIASAVALTMSIVVLAATQNYLPKYAADGSLVNSAIYESGGSVGIGTTSPLAPLHVFGPNAQLILERANSSNASAINFRTAGPVDNYIMGTRVYDANTDFQIGTGGSKYISLDVSAATLTST